MKNLAADIDSDFFRQVAVGDGDGDIGDVAHLGGQIARHNVDAFGQILPNAAHVTNLRLAAKLSFGADLARDTGDFRGETAQLIDHGVDCVFELENLAADIDSDFFRQVAVGDGDGDIGDVAHLVGQIAGHEVDAVGEILPGAGDTRNQGLAAELSFGADLACDTGDFRGETAQLVHHGVDCVFELENLAFDVHRDFFGQIAIGDGDGDIGDVAHLGGQVAGHGIDAVGEILPGAGHSCHHRLPTEFSVRTDLPCDASDFGSETSQLVYHRVDGFLELQNLAADIDCDLFGQVAVGDGDGDIGDVTDLGGQIAGHEVDAVGEILPGAGDSGYHGLAAEFSFGADLACDTRNLSGKGVELFHHSIDHFGGAQEFASERLALSFQCYRLR